VPVTAADPDGSQRSPPSRKGVRIRQEATAQYVFFQLPGEPAVAATQPTLPPAAALRRSTLSPTCHVPNVGRGGRLSPRARAALSKPDRKAALRTGQSALRRPGAATARAASSPRSRPRATRRPRPAARRRRASRTTTISAIAPCMPSRCSTRAGRAVRRATGVTFSPSWLTGLGGGTGSAHAPRWATKVISASGS
jgi:hypothetical protein